MGNTARTIQGLRAKCAAQEQEVGGHHQLTVLVTGGAGYIGCHVVNELLARGTRVVVLDDLRTGHQAAVPGGVLVKGACGNAALVRQVVREYQVNSVVHLAADSLVGESMDNPAKYCRNNLAESLTLLDVLRAEGIRRFVFSSTAAVYGEPTTVPITEGHPVKPVNVYGATKRMFEQVLDWHDRAYGMRYISLRYFNAAGADVCGRIGEDHNPETHLIPIVLQTALGLRKKVTVFGNDYPTPDGTCIRDYVHVTDLARAHILALNALGHGLPSAVYNLGNGRGYSVKDVIIVGRQVTGKNIPVKVGPRRLGDPAVLVASSAKIKQELGWEQRFGELEVIMGTAWKWHQGHPFGYCDICKGRY